MLQGASCNRAGAREVAAKRLVQHLKQRGLCNLADASRLMVETDADSDGTHASGDDASSDEEVSDGVHAADIVAGHGDWWFW